MNQTRMFVVLIVLWAGITSAQYGTNGLEWRHYGGDHGSTKYAPLDQINPGNFDELEVAWRWESADKALMDVTGMRPHHLRGTPLTVDGTIYLPTGLNQIVAIDASSGEQKWVFDPQAYLDGPPTHSMWQHRGLEYWKDGDDERLFLATGGRQLVSIDAKTGKPDPDFADNGVMSLKKDLGRDNVNWRNIGHSSPVVVVGNSIMVGSIIFDFPSLQDAPPGHLRAYDTRTGMLKWRFNSIPTEGQTGNETWEDNSWAHAGNTNVWSMMSIDDELGYVYLPFGTPTNDYYGGHRHGANLFAESLVCLNAETGERVWHFQAVHHGLWDYDFPCAPNVVDVVVDGKAVKAVAQVSKQGFCYVFNRITGEPLWPIEERAVPASIVEGEEAYPTQPFPTKPAPFELQGLSEDDLIDFTPELFEEARAIIGKRSHGPIFTPPTVMNADGTGGTISVPGMAGGANWPGAAVDPETGILYVPSITGPAVIGLQKPDPSRSNFNYVVALGALRLSGPQGLPLTKPQYRRFTAINLNTGEHEWQVPFGPGPKNHPLLKDLDLPDLGSPFPDRVIADGGLMVTRTLVIAHMANMDWSTGVEVLNGSLLQAYDKATGELLAEVPVDRHLHGPPTSVLVDGRQYIFITGGGGGVEPSELLAFALPE